MQIATVAFCLLAVIIPVYVWLFRHLPGERWQFLAAIPLRKKSDGSWRSINLTFYGVFTAIAGFIAISLFLFMTGSIALAPSQALLMVVLCLMVCLPAAKLIARYVEGNPHGFTVGGASFVGIILSPPLLALGMHSAWFAALDNHYMAILAAMSITYVIGEGIGRLACISFGCCYGKPLRHSPLWVQRLLRAVSTVYWGKTKKIAFAGDMEAVQVIPIQAMTCLLFTLLALIGIVCFYHAEFTAAFLVTLIGSQLWRFYSEFFRADYRGSRHNLTQYQYMALMAAVYAIVVAQLSNADLSSSPSATLGLAALWTPLSLLCIAGVTVVLFICTGVSTITTAEIRFGLCPDALARECAQTPGNCSHSHDARGAAVRRHQPAPPL